MLANKYGIECLSSLALKKLHQTLIVWELSVERVQDVVSVARYTYQNTSSASRCPLRYIVIDYIVSEHWVVTKSPDFDDLLEEGGEFAVDFWKSVSGTFVVPDEGGEWIRPFLP